MDDAPFSSKNEVDADVPISSATRMKLKPAGQMLGSDSDDNKKPFEERCKKFKEVHDVWTCAVCGEAFNCGDDLNGHHLTHTVKDLSNALYRLQDKGRTGKKRKVSKSHSTANEKCQISEKIVDKINVEKDDDFEWPEEESFDKWMAPVEVLEFRNKPGPKPKYKPPGPPKRAYRKKLGPDGLPLKKVRKSSSKKNPGSRDPHPCSVCGKILSSRGNMAKHMVLHESSKPWVCDKCGLGFNAKRDFRYHTMQKHTGERPFVCDVCGHGFVYKNYLVEHMNYHKAEKQFICETCGKHLSSVNCLKKHQKRHSVDRPHSCSLCGKTFAINYDLTAHKKSVHEGVKKSKVADKHCSGSVVSVQNAPISISEVQSINVVQHPPPTPHSDQLTSLALPQPDLPVYEIIPLAGSDNMDQESITIEVTYDPLALPAHHSTGSTLQHQHLTASEVSLTSQMAQHMLNMHYM